MNRKQATPIEPVEDIADADFCDYIECKHKVRVNQLTNKPICSYKDMTHLPCRHMDRVKVWKTKKLLTEEQGLNKEDKLDALAGVLRGN